MSAFSFLSRSRWSFPNVVRRLAMASPYPSTAVAAPRAVGFARRTRRATWFEPVTRHTPLLVRVAALGTPTRVSTRLAVSRALRLDTLHHTVTGHLARGHGPRSYSPPASVMEKRAVNWSPGSTSLQSPVTRAFVGAVMGSRQPKSAFAGE